MYIIDLINGKTTTNIHGAKEKLKSGSIVKGINSIDSFSFSLYPSNPGFNRVNDYLTLVSVYNTVKKRYEFQGRVLYSCLSMDESGLIYRDVVCESYFGFLCDSQQPYVDTQNWTVRGLLQHLIDNHNALVEDYKRFTIGEVTATDPNDNLYQGIQREDTWTAIKNKLLDKIGGELRFRVVDGVNYIDYLEKIGETRATPIELSRNMQSISREVDPTELITRLIPLGAKIKDDAGNDTEQRVDITSENGGKNYIDIAGAGDTTSIRVGYAYFDGVTNPKNLLSKGRAYLAENNKIKVKYTAKALDLSLLGLDIDDFNVHDYHPIINPLLGIDDTARIIKKNINVCEEIQSSIEFGEQFKALTDIQRDQAVEAVKKIESAQNDLKNYVADVKTELSGRIDEIETGGEDDVGEELNDIRQSITEQHTSIISDCQSIILSALETYTETSNFEQFKKTVESELKLLNDELTLKFSETETKIQNVDGDLQSKFNSITKYFTFDINGMTIGQTDSPYKMVLDNDRFSMLVNGVEVMWIANGEVHTPDLSITKSFKIFDYLISLDNAGNVNGEYVGV